MRTSRLFTSLVLSLSISGTSPAARQQTTEVVSTTKKFSRGDYVYVVQSRVGERRFSSRVQAVAIKSGATVGELEFSLKEDGVSVAWQAVSGSQTVMTFSATGKQTLVVTYALNGATQRIETQVQDVLKLLQQKGWDMRLPAFDFGKDRSLRDSIGQSIRETIAEMKTRRNEDAKKLEEYVRQLQTGQMGASWCGTMQEGCANSGSVWSCGAYTGCAIFEWVCAGIC
jgi:hypothetical protein